MVKQITDTYQVPLIIDDRLDVCLAVDAAGLHIGDDELPVSVARQVLGTEKILGVTAKNSEKSTRSRRIWGGLPGTEQFSHNNQGKCPYYPHFYLKGHLPSSRYSSRSDWRFNLKISINFLEQVLLVSQ